MLLTAGVKIVAVFSPTAIALDAALLIKTFENPWLQLLKEPC
jgi:hypothetical protein